MIDKKQPLSNLTFVAFDTETTGLAPVRDRIIEIGAVKFRLGETIGTFQELVDPGKRISAGATAVNGIADEMVRGRPRIGDVLPRFLDFLGNAVPIAHNAPFDVGFLSYDISRLNLKTESIPILDTCAIPRRVFPHSPNYKLETLASYLHIESDRFHRALEDANVCMGVFLKCLDNMGNPDLLILDDVLTVNGPCLDLGPAEIILDESYLPLKTAMESGRSLKIVYQDVRGNTTTREITPLSLGLGRHATILEAFCHVRQDKRNFRLDRIKDIR